MGHHLLVVDDDAAIRHVLALILESEHYQIAEAANGQQALDAIADALPRAMFLDMQMPVLDGPAVVHHLQAEGRHIPTVVMTAQADVQRWCAELGADSCLAKPFDVDDVLAAAAWVSHLPADT